MWQKKRPKIGKLFEKSVAIVLFLLVWEVSSQFDLINSRFLPPPSRVVVGAVEGFISGELVPHLIVSLARAAGGFFLGVITAVPIGLALGWYPQLARFLDPLLQLLRQTNPVSLLPVFILFLGIGYWTKVAIIYWVVFWPIFIGAMTGVKYVDRDLVRYAKSVAFSDRKLFIKVVLPSALPSIMGGMRLSATYSFLMLVVSEMVGANSGLGYLILNATYLHSVVLLYVGVIVVATLGIASNSALVALEKKLCPWREEVEP